MLARGCWTPVERFALASGWQAGAQDASGAFDVLWQGNKQGRVKWDLLGEHNRLNALAAIAAARHAGVPPAVAIEALAQFKNVRRRMEVRGVVNGVTVYDDFAHHPTAIATTLAGLRRQGQAMRAFIAVIEPRSNTMKLGVMKEALPGSLADADQVFCYSGGPRLGCDGGACPAGRQGCGACDDFDATAAADRCRRARRRPRAGHEQRRFRRHSRQTAEALGRKSDGSNFPDDALGAFCAHTHAAVKGSGARSARRTDFRRQGYLRHRRP